MVIIEYENIVVKGDESAGGLKFVLLASEPADEPFTVRVCTRELNETSGGPTYDGSATGYLSLVYVLMNIHIDIACTLI